MENIQKDQFDTSSEFSEQFQAEGFMESKESTFISELTKQDIQDFFEESGITSPPLPEDINILQIEDFLFSNITSDNLPLHEASWEDLLISYQEFATEDTNSTEKLETTEPSLENNSTPQVLLGFTGHGFNSWNFVYHFIGKHVVLHIYTSLLSIINLSEEESQQDFKLDMCYKIADLCLKLENDQHFFSEQGRNKVCLILDDNKTNFLILDKNNIVCSQGSSLEEFFNYIENNFEIIEQKELPAQIWMKI